MEFEVELAKPNTPNKSWRQFSPQALECIVDKWNREHDDSEMKIRNDGSLILITRGWGKIVDGEFVADEVPDLKLCGVGFSEGVKITDDLKI